MTFDAVSGMKIVHLPYTYFPDASGGTEVYVQGLAQALQKEGVQNVIVAPAEKTRDYNHNGLPVHRLPICHPPPSLRVLYGEGDDVMAKKFARLLDEIEPDIVHMHAFTSAVSLRLVKAAKTRGTPVVFTYHTPTVSCARGTLLCWGQQICDGMLYVRRCARCTLHGLGVNRAGSILLGSVPPAAGRMLGKVNRSGGLWTALRMTELIALRHDAVRTLMQTIDRVVVLCDWAKALLERNGVSAEKIVVSHHGLSQTYTPASANGQRPDVRQRPLRVAFLGRLDPTKGLEILIHALQGLPTADVQLDIYGIVQSEDGETYRRHLEATAAADRRISFHVPVPGDQVISTLRNYHVLVVPSQLLETGPLVVLEAFAAGIPVVGSNLGGVAEWVEHGVNGLLVEADATVAWGRALHRLARDRTLLERLTAQVQPPRTMDSVAQEMLGLYRSLLTSQVRNAT